MAETSPIPTRSRTGMMVNQRGPFSNEGRHHYYSQLIEVVDTVEDENFGGGIVGFSVLTGQPVIVFSNPVMSESRKNAKNAKSMTDWVNGLKVLGNVYTFGPGAYVFVQDIATRANQPRREIVVDGEKYSAEVLFCQWIQSWQSVEQAEKAEKSIFWGYGIAQAIPGDEERRENVRFHVFFAKGYDNRFNEGENLYPVVFRFKNLPDLLAHIDAEAKKFSGAFTGYMARIIEDKSGKIVGQGEIISCYDYRNPQKPASEVFLYNLARRLSLTSDGVAKLLSADGYSFEVFGLMEIVPSRYMAEDNNGKPALSEVILENQRFVPRNAPRSEGGVQRELWAVPTAFRGKRNEETGAFWLDKANIIGFVGMSKDGELSADSDIIDADAYSGTPSDPETGKILERGLERIIIPYGEGESQIVVDNMRNLARIIDCEFVQYPDGRWNEAFFNDNWDKRGANTPEKPVQKPAAQQQSEPASQPAAQTRRRPAPAAAQAAPAPEHADEVPF